MSVRFAPRAIATRMNIQEALLKACRELEI